MSFFTTLFQYHTGSPGICNKKRKWNEIKGILIGNKEINLFASDIVIYVKSKKKRISKKLLELINYSKSWRYRWIKSQLISYVSARTRGIWNYNTMLCTLAPQKVKYLGIYLIKNVQDLYEENYKTLRSKIKEVSKWRASPCLQIERLNIIKILVLPNFIYRFNATPVKSQQVILWLSKNWFQSLYREGKTQNNQHSPKEEKQSQRTDTTLTLDLLYSYNNQHSVVFMEEVTSESLEWNRERNRPTWV